MKRLGIAIGLCASLALSADVADACGGCFHAEDQVDQTSLVTSHVMALSISSSQTVLWDQVQFTGSPEDFAWVLPVRPGAYLEVASDAFMEALTAATNARVSPPQLDCAGDDFEACDGRAQRYVPSSMAFACGSAEAGDEGDGTIPSDQDPDPVTVVHQGSAGPYETVTLRAEVPGVLTTWLQDNGYAIAADVQPVIDEYQNEGFDFIALRLAPQRDVQQMKPVRVVMPGAVVGLPLRMVAAGTGANVALTLFVIGEGRWNVANFPAAEVDNDLLQWDFSSAGSNYDQMRNGLQAGVDGRTWVTTYAAKNSLLSPQPNPIDLSPTRYGAGGVFTTTIAEAFARQGFANGETDEIAACIEAFQQIRDSDVEVAPACDDGTCEVPETFIDGEELHCGAIDDLAVALTGMRPRDVWLTRLDANLPRAALATDLVLEADQAQTPVKHWNIAQTATNAPCPLGSSSPLSGRRSGMWLAIIVLGGLMLGGSMRRLSRKHANC